MQDQANTKQTSIAEPDSPRFEPLQPGYTLLGQGEMRCEDECGGTYYQRSFITPDGWTIIERTPCQCMMPKLQQRVSDWEIDQVKTYRANLTYKANQYFGSYDLLSDGAFNRMSFDNYKASASQKQAVDKLKEFRVGDGSICLYGAAGRGKTHLALSVARKAKQEGLSVLALKAIDMLTRLKRTYDRKDDVAEIDIMRVLKNIDLLVIDDIGQEKTTEWVRAKFYEIIDYRHRRRSTIYTTNLSSGETERKEGQALVSRIWGSELRLEIGGEDYRFR